MQAEDLNKFYAISWERFDKKFRLFVWEMKQYLIPINQSWNFSISLLTLLAVFFSLSSEANKPLEIYFIEAETKLLFCYWQELKKKNNICRLSFISEETSCTFFVWDIYCMIFRVLSSWISKLFDRHLHVQWHSLNVDWLVLHLAHCRSIF